MKTKRFLLATSGATVDGRSIDEKMLQEMADSYDPKTYGARLNIEHIRGISGDGAFRAYGDVLSLETEKVTVNFNGEDEDRLGLYGVFEVNDDAKKLNQAGQKLYPSIEINPNFADKGFAYLMGCALTDSPASIATDRLQFSRTMPGNLQLSQDKEGASFELEFAAEGETGENAGDSFLGKLGNMLDGFASKFGAAPEAPEGKPPAGSSEDETPPALDFTQLRPLLDEFSKGIASELDSFRQEVRADSDRFGVKLKALEDKLETQPSNQHNSRPIGAGENGNRFKTDF